MNDARVIGHLIAHPGGLLTGWCWSPDRPTDRLVCEILADEAPVARVRAGEAVAGLRERGFGDGRHGFRATPPAAILGHARLLTARERDGGAIFARLHLDNEPAPDPRLAQLAAGVQRLRDRLFAHPPDDVPGRAVRAGIGAVGRRLSARAGGDVGAARTEVGRMLAGLTLPIVARPAASVVLLVAGAARAARVLHALAPALIGALGGPAAELLVVDAQDDARASVVGACLPGAAMVPASTTPGVSDALARALTLARAPWLIVLDDAPVGPPGWRPSAAALADLLDAAGGIVVGDGVARLAMRLGVIDALRSTPTRAPGRLPLLLAAPRDLVLRVGGLDPALDTAPQAAVLDLCLKAAALRVPTTWVSPVAGPVPAAPPPLPPIAEALLATRWGGVRRLSAVV